MSRDGLIQRNEATGEVERVSQRGQDFRLKAERPGQQRFTPGSAPRGERGGRWDGYPVSAAPESEILTETGSFPEMEGLPGVQPLPVRAADAPVRPGEPEQHKSGSAPAPAGRRKHGGLRTARDTPASGKQRPVNAGLHSAPRGGAGLTENPHGEPELAGQDAAPLSVRDTPGREGAVPVSLESTDTPAPLAERPGRLRFDKPAARAGSVRKTIRRGTAYRRRFDGAGGKDSVTPADARNGSGPPVPAGASNADALPDDSGSRAAAPAARPMPGRAAGPEKASRLLFPPEERDPGTAWVREKSPITDTVGSAVEGTDKKISRARIRAEQADKKLSAAAGKLPAKKTMHIDRAPDPATGKIRRRLRFETEAKTQREHVRGALALRPVKAASRAGSRWVHKKIYEAGQENAGVEAAHKGEMVARALRYSARTRPYRRVSKLRRQDSKARFKLEWRKTLKDNPGLKRSVSRMLQKRKIKKQYQLAHRGGGLARRAAVRTAKAAAQSVKALVTAIQTHPAAAAAIVGAVLLVIIISGIFASCSGMAAGAISATAASSYTAPDAEIDDAEIAYTLWEHNLRMEIDNVETARSGYDEYNCDLGEIGHDPFELLAYLTAKHDDFTFADVEADLLEVFGGQYDLEYEEETETRYRDPDDDDEDGDREPYEWRILNVTLTVTPLSDVLAGRISGEQGERYDLLMETHGNRQYIVSPFAFDWLPYVTDVYGWRVHPITFAEDFHTGLDIGVAEGTELLAGHDGTVTSSGSAGDYGLAVVVAGEDGLSSRYAHCSELLVTVGQEVRKGDVIAKVGSTGMSTGAHLHVEVILDGRYLNPIFFAEGSPREE